MYCLVYFYAAFSRVLRNKNLHHDQKRKLRYTLHCYVVELAVGSEQKLYFCYDSSDPVFTEYDSNQDNRHRTSPT